MVDATKEDRLRLYKAILSLETQEECEDFFEDLLTIAEMNAACQRLKVAVLLDQKITTQKIAQETGASTATVTRVNKCLNYGKGYKNIVKKLKDNEE